MKCAYCDAELKFGATVCPNCGSPVHSEASIIREPQPVQRKKFLRFPTFTPGSPPPPPTYAPPAAPGPAGPPPYVSTAQPFKMTPGMVSLMLGIFSLVAVPSGLICAIGLIVPGLIAGYKGLKSPSRSLAIVGLGLNGLALLILIIMAVVFAALIVYGMMSTSPSSPGT